MDCSNVQDQFSLLSSIPNFHWWQYIRCDGRKSSSDICVNLTDHLLYHPSCEETDTFKLKYIPKSPRNRLMYYIYTGSIYADAMKKLIDQLLKLDKKEDTPFPISSDNNSHFSHHCPPKKGENTPPGYSKLHLKCCVIICMFLLVKHQTVFTQTQVFTINSRNN